MPGPLASLRTAAAVASLALAIASPAYAQTSAAGSIAASATESAGKVWNGAQDVAAYALGLLGVEYRFGGNTPERGLDCSGLVGYVFSQVTGVSLPRTSRELSGIGAKVNLSELAPGDLVFFNTRRFAFSHVGIYLGDNQFVHAPSRGSEVSVAHLTSPYWRKSFNGARRLVGVLPSLVPNLVTPAFAGELPPRVVDEDEATTP